ncbi:hypothetical protein [Burkholderia sp. LMG 32019]|uniref:hypothetical protein n=1 Tax=Burkholderia sp. LMG 32019 TaxID=3158173 RepID=UPI003C2FDCE3
MEIESIGYRSKVFAIIYELLRAEGNSYPESAHHEDAEQEVDGRSLAPTLVVQVEESEQKQI